MRPATLDASVWPPLTHSNVTGTMIDPNDGTATHFPDAQHETANEKKNNIIYLIFINFFYS